MTLLSFAVCLHGAVQSDAAFYVSVCFLVLFLLRLLFVCILKDIFSCLVQTTTIVTTTTITTTTSITTTTLYILVKIAREGRRCWVVA